MSSTIYPANSQSSYSPSSTSSYTMSSTASTADTSRSPSPEIGQTFRDGRSSDHKVKVSQTKNSRTGQNIVLIQHNRSSNVDPAEPKSSDRY